MNGEERWEFIYNQINGLNEPDVCGWVKDEIGRASCRERVSA